MALPCHEGHTVEDVYQSLAYAVASSEGMYLHCHFSFLQNFINTRILLQHDDKGHRLYSVMLTFVGQQ